MNSTVFCNGDFGQTPILRTGQTGTQKNPPGYLGSNKPQVPAIPFTLVDVPLLVPLQAREQVSQDEVRLYVNEVPPAKYRKGPQEKPRAREAVGRARR